MSKVLYADGEHDDTDALESWLNGEDVIFPEGESVGDELLFKQFKVSDYIRMYNYNPTTHKRLMCMDRNIIHEGPRLSDEELDKRLGYFDTRTTDGLPENTPTGSESEDRQFATV